MQSNRPPVQAPATSGHESAGIQSLETGIALFRCLHRLGRPAPLGELAAVAGLHPSKAHRYLASLVRSGLVSRDGRGTYALGPFARELAEAPASATDVLLASASARLDELGRTLDDTVFVARWKRGGPVVVAVVESARPISMRPASNGRELPLWNSATSRAFLAFMERRTALDLIDAELDAAVAGGAARREMSARRRLVVEQLDATRRHGVARTTGERQKGLASLSAPIFAGDGAVALAVTVIGVAATLDARWNGEPAAALKAFAEAVGGRR